MLSPILLDIPETPRGSHLQIDSGDGIANSDVTPFTLFDLFPDSPTQPPALHRDLLNIPDSPILSVPSLLFEIAPIPDSKPVSPMLDSMQEYAMDVDFSHLEIPDTPEKMSLDYIDLTDIPDSPQQATPTIDLTANTSDMPRRSAAPIGPQYDMAPCLPIITSEAAFMRLVLADKITERARLQKWLDTVRTQLAEVDRQILTLETIGMMRDEAERMSNKTE